MKYPIEFGTPEMPNGDLKITANEAAIEWLREQRPDSTDNRVLWDMLESQWTNGGLYPFDAGQGNPFVGLTSAPCIAEAMTYDDEGKKEILGRFWYYEPYQVRSFIDELIEHGEVVFTLGPQQ